ncbi:MAG: hypothetical protein SGPRY_014330, partial [Prymnesium sp.]
LVVANIAEQCNEPVSVVHKKAPRLWRTRCALVRNATRGGRAPQREASARPRETQGCRGQTAACWRRLVPSTGTRTGTNKRLDCVYVPLPPSARLLRRRARRLRKLQTCPRQMSTKTCVVMGRAGLGKTSLLNALFRDFKGEARESPTAVTKVTVSKKCGSWTVFDTPGHRNGIRSLPNDLKGKVMILILVDGRWEDELQLYEDAYSTWKDNMVYVLSFKVSSAASSSLQVPVIRAADLDQLREKLETWDKCAPQNQSTSISDNRENAPSTSNPSQPQAKQKKKKKKKPLLQLKVPDIDVPREQIVRALYNRPPLTQSAIKKGKDIGDANLLLIIRTGKFKVSEDKAKSNDSLVQFLKEKFPDVKSLIEKSCGENASDESIANGLEYFFSLKEHIGYGLLNHYIK